MMKRMKIILILAVGILLSPSQTALHAQELTDGFADVKIPISRVLTFVPDLVLTTAERNKGEMTWLEFVTSAFLYIDDLEASPDQESKRKANKYHRKISEACHRMLRQDDWHYMKQSDSYNRVLAEKMQERDARKALEDEQSLFARLPSISDTVGTLVSCAGAVRNIFQQAQDVRQQLQDAGLIPNAAAGSSAGPAQSRSHAAAQPAARPAARPAQSAHRPAPSRSSTQSAPRSRSAPRSYSSSAHRTVGADPTPEQIEHVCEYIERMRNGCLRAAR